MVEYKQSGAGDWLSFHNLQFPLAAILPALPVFSRELTFYRLGSALILQIVSGGLHGGGGYYIHWGNIQ